MSLYDRYKHSKKQSDFSLNRPKLGHIKPYTNNSDNYEELTLAKYKSAQDLNLIEFKSDLLYSIPNDSEEIQSLKSTIDSLQKKIGEFESRICKNCKIFDHENKKLKSSLKNAEENTERLYKENGLLSEQLTILQKKFEGCSITEDDPNEALKQYLKRMILSFEDDLEENLQNLVRNLKIAENRLDKIATKQLSLSKKSFFSLDEYTKIEQEKHSIRCHYDKSLESKNFKLQEYENEIFRLGQMIVRFQEKYEELVKVQKDSIKDLKSENFQLKEEISLLYLKFDEKSKLTPKTSIAGQSLHFQGYKLDDTKKLIEDHKNQIEYLTEFYTAQLEKLNVELETLRYSYSQQETLLLHSQELTKRQEEVLKNAQGPLLSQITEQNSMISSQSLQISALSEENTKLKSELKDCSSLEITKKYSRLVLEFNTNEEIIEKTQKSLELAEKTIKDQESIINSLKQGFYPHNSPKELLDNPSDSSFKDLLDKKNSVIEEMRNQLLFTSQDQEKLLLDLQKTSELYNSCKDELKVLQKVVENLQFELQSIRSNSS